VIGVDVAEHSAPGECDNQTELRQRHHQHPDLQLGSTFRVHGYVTHVATEHVEQDRDSRQPREDGHQIVTVVALDERRVGAHRRRQRPNSEQVQRRQTDAEECQSTQQEADANSSTFVEQKRYRQHIAICVACVDLLSDTKVTFYLAAGKTLPEALCFTAGSTSSFLASRPTCDKTADRRRVKSILVLRTYVWHE